MGSRGPQPGAQCKECKEYDRSLRISSWREHREAERFTDWLGSIRDELARDAFPQNRMGFNGRAALVNALEAFQGKIIDGMGRFVVRESEPANTAGHDEDENVDEAEEADYEPLALAA